MSLLVTIVLASAGSVDGIAEPLTATPATRNVAGQRWTPTQLRLRVAPAWRGKPILDAQQLEDVVVFLSPLRE